MAPSGPFPQARRHPPAPKLRKGWSGCRAGCLALSSPGLAALSSPEGPQCPVVSGGPEPPRVGLAAGPQPALPSATLCRGCASFLAAELGAAEPGGCVESESRSALSSVARLSASASRQVLSGTARVAADARLEAQLHAPAPAPPTSPRDAGAHFRTQPSRGRVSSPPSSTPLGSPGWGGRQAAPTRGAEFEPNVSGGALHPP